MRTGVCKLCRRTAELQKSHLIPRAIFQKVKGGEKENIARIEKNIGATYPPGGGHIKAELLCHECEELFSKSEKTVANDCYVFNGRFPLFEKTKSISISDQYRQLTLPINKTSRFIFKDDWNNVINGNAFLYFALSIFWRTSIFYWPRIGSSYYDALGRKYSEQIRMFLLTQNHQYLSHIYVCAVIQTVTPLAVISFPSCTKMNMFCWSHSFFIPGIMFIMYVGKQLPDCIEGLKSIDDFSFLEKDITQSKSYTNLCETILTTPAKGKLIKDWISS